MYCFRGPVTIAYSLLQNIAEVVCSGQTDIVSLDILMALHFINF